MLEKSTSHDAIELTERVYAAANSRDVDAIMGFVGSACVCDVTRWQLGTFEGLDAIRGFAAQWFDLYDYWVHVVETQDLGQGVVCIGQVARHTHAPHNYMQWSSAMVLQWAQGKLARVTVYSEFDEACAEAEQIANERAG